DDEVRPVLRPHLGGPDADVRNRLPEPGAALRHARGDRAPAPALDADRRFPVRSTGHPHARPHDGATERSASRDRRHRSLRSGPRPAGHGARPAARQPLRRGTDGMTTDDPGRQPHWRGDFPIDWPEAQWVARREFVKFLMPVSLAFAVGQLWLVWRGWRRASAPAPAPARIARVSDVPVGGAMLFEY